MYGKLENVDVSFPIISRTMQIPWESNSGFLRFLAPDPGHLLAYFLDTSELSTSLCSSLRRLGQALRCTVILPAWSRNRYGRLFWSKGVPPPIPGMVWEMFCWISLAIWSKPVCCVPGAALFFPVRLEWHSQVICGMSWCEFSCVWSLLCPVCQVDANSQV